MVTRHRAPVPYQPEEPVVRSWPTFVGGVLFWVVALALLTLAA